MTVETDLQNAVTALNNTHTSFQTALATVNAGVATVNTKAGEATAAATTANNKAGEATAARDTAVQKAAEATTGAATATNQATTATNAATTATQKAADAQNGATQAIAAAVSAGAPVLQSLVDGPAVSWDVSAGKYAALTMGGNRSIYFSKIKAGEEYRLFLYQDSTGGRTPKFSARIKWAGDVTPTWTTTPNSLTIIRFSSNGTMLFGAIEQVYDGYIPDVANDFRDPNIYNDMPAWLDYSGITGNRMYYDSTGKLTWAPNNVLLNSATLATQTVAVTVGMTNILSFSGTGSITLSGAATGTLAGTGANNRVFLLITMATTSLTLTVTGSVTQAQLERVTYQTTPRPWISTGAAAVYLPRFTYDPATLLPIGLWIEGSRSNLALWSSDFTNTSWTKANVTIPTNSVVSQTGLTVTKNTVSETGTISTNYDLYQSAAITSGANYALSGVVKKIGRRYVRLIISASSSGSVWVAGQFDLDTGTFVTEVGSGGGTLVSASMEDQGNGLYFLSLSGSVADTAALFFFGSGQSGAISNTDIRGRATVTGINGDAFNLFDAQIELGSFASSRIPTTTAVVTRAADVLKLSGAALTIANGAIGSAIVQTTKLALNSSSYIILGDSGNRRLIFSNQLGYNLASSYEGSATLAATFGSGSWTTTPSRAATGWDNSGRSIVANNGTVATDIKTFSSAPNLFLGSDGGVTNINGVISSIALYNRRLPDATLKSKSILEASF